MIQSVWQSCLENIQLLPLQGEVYRVVESQEKIATNQLVDTLEEQAILEDLLEQTKPRIPEGATDLAYLLFTPFRYPPLAYGSRFGRRYESGLFYSSRKSQTALAETAYYRLHFWYDMAVPPPSGKLLSQHTVFSVAIRTEKGLKLQNSPFVQYQGELVHKMSYQSTQLLGSLMRENGVHAFEFISARDILQNLNVALFYPQVLKDKRPDSCTNMLCETTDQGVNFIDDNNIVYKYPVEDFHQDNAFPDLNNAY